MVRGSNLGEPRTKAWILSQRWTRWRRAKGWSESATSRALDTSIETTRSVPGARLVEEGALGGAEAVETICSPPWRRALMGRRRGEK